MYTRDFHFDLPEDLIAQTPTELRDQSRMLVLDRRTGQIEHRQFCEFPDYLKAGNILVLNDTRVIRARLRGEKKNGGGRVEILLVEEITINQWWVMLRPGKRVRPGIRLEIKNPRGEPTRVEATVIRKNQEGHCHLEFTGVPNILEQLDSIGEVPLPPYIGRAEGALAEVDGERYQTVFAKQNGSVAAPTAGLHFTNPMLNQIREKDVETCGVTLHIGLGTFAPVKTERVSDHSMHEECFQLSESTAHTIGHGRKTGNRIIAVGTTSLRVLESVAAANNGKLCETSDRTRLFIHPPYRFRAVDALLTNFHLPQSTLMMLVCAFAAPNEIRGRDLILSVYKEAIRERYRFFSYGDAMLIL